MHFLLLLPILFLPCNPPQDPPSDQTAPVAVVSFKWYKDRRVHEAADTPVVAQRAPNVMERQNRNYERQKRVNDTGGMRDPNENTIEARSAALESIVQQSREEKPPPVDGFTYEAKIQNKSTKLVKTVFLEFQFTEKTNPANTSRRQFICRAKMKPEKLEELRAFSLVAPSGVVSVGTLKKKSHADDFDERVRINRVEYDDGTIWQRKDWDFDEVKLTVKPAAKSANLQPCRGL